MKRNCGMAAEISIIPEKENKYKQTNIINIKINKIFTKNKNLENSKNSHVQIRSGSSEIPERESNN